MHPGIFSAGTENCGHWPWPSWSFWPFCLRIPGNSACPCDKWSQIWAWITNFAPNMLSGILLPGIENWGNWPWPSKSFWPSRKFGLYARLLVLDLSQNHQICILGFLGLSWLVLKIGVNGLDLQSHLAISTIYQCPVQKYKLSSINMGWMSTATHYWSMGLLSIHFKSLQLIRKSGIHRFYLRYTILK